MTRTINPETAVEPPNTQMNADKTKQFMKKANQPFGLNQDLI